MNDTYTYKTPQSKRMMFAFVAFIIMFIFAVFFIPKMRLIGVIGITIAIYFTTAQRILVSREGIRIKPFVGNGLFLSATEGAFSMVEQRGAKAFFMTGSSPTKTLIFTPKNGKKAKTFFPVISQEDQDDMEKRIQEIYA